MSEGKEQTRPNFKDACFALRDSLKHAEGIALTLGELAVVCPFEEDPSETDEKLLQRHEERSEMIANVKLAYRHLEDARMRIGKAIQAFDGGESCYPK